MSRLCFVACFLLLALVSCQPEPQQTILRPGNLKPQVFTIDTERDTAIITLQGARLTIPKGSIDGGGRVVQLEVREAYTIADIVKAGLTTKSGKDPLSSGGMIYTNATNKSAKVVKPITVSMPTVMYRETMSVYSGEYKKDSTIDWVDPRPLARDTADNLVKCGKTLFVANCAACHNVYKDATGPSLLFMFYKNDEQWIEDFVRNPAKMFAEGDAYANCQKNRFGGVLMTAFPTLTHSDFECMRAYLDNEIAKKYDPSHVRQLKKSFDSCRRYMELAYPELAKRDKLIADNGPQVITNTYESPDSGKTWVKDERGHAYNAPDDAVGYYENNAVHYQFTIDNFGWYNIDILTSDIPSFEPSSLTVTVNGAPTSEINVYLIIPGEKVFIRAGTMGNERNKYAFYTNDGRLPLPQNREAYILVFGDHDGKIVYANTGFTTSHEQSFTLDVRPTTKQGFLDVVAQFGKDGLRMNVADAKNAEGIRKLDKELESIESLKPKGCECECGDGVSK